MVEMRAERKNIFDYLSKNKFVIPMYQRNYVWDEEECEQLWEDVYDFFQEIDEGGEGDFKDGEYFLGSVVMHKDNNRQNIIDGQQRTTTLNLLIRALYEKAKGDSGIDKLKESLASCLWDINPLTGDVDFEKTHFESKVATDLDNTSLENLFKEVLNIEEDAKKQSLYEKNFIFFQTKSDKLAQDKPYEWKRFCLCLLSRCVVLPIECDEQNKALRIFHTLNNRGVPLFPADVFKGLIFEDKKTDDEKKQFAKEWKELETKIQNSDYLKEQDITFLFDQYEDIIRAQRKKSDTVVPTSLDFWTQADKLKTRKRKVFAPDPQENLLCKNETFDFIKKLGQFWCDPYEYLSPQAQKYFAVLSMYKGKFWQMVVSVCFYEFDKDKDKNKNIFDEILPQIVAHDLLEFIYRRSEYKFSHLLSMSMKANINIIEGKRKNIFEKSIDLKMHSLNNFIHFFKIQKLRPKEIRYILAIYALLYSEKQELEWNQNGENYSLTEKAETEHIFPKKWQDTSYNGWQKEEAEEYLEHIGNKILLEKKENIQAGNGYFNHKKEKYKNSHFIEAQDLAKSEKKDWLKEDIIERDKQIYQKFKEFFETIFQ